MTFTFKLARRLSLGQCSLYLASAAVLGCASGDTVSPSDGSDSANELAALHILPKTVTLETNQRLTYHATALASNGDSLTTSLEWTASGGTINADGIFSASSAGTYKVIGRGRGKNKPPADTGVVIVVPPQPSLSKVVITPDSATVQAGKITTFSASGRLSDGSTVAIGVNWTATGGTIDGGGNYTAGATVGTYRVIATNTAGTLADTATVRITAAPAPTLARIVLVPATATVAVGGTVQLAAFGRTTTGDSVAAPVSYTATGGTVSASGLYTAGQTPGTYSVIARSTAAPLADTTAITVTSGSTPTTHAGRYVAPNGSSSGDGTAARPWDLASVLSGSKPIQPGDTVWLRGGTYSGRFSSQLSGTSAAPIIVRQYPGERATIRGTMAVNGAYTWYWGFEVANGNISTQDVMGIDSHGPGTRFINLVVHDHTGNGLGVWSEAPDAEVYGSLIYNNGFCGSSGTPPNCTSHGHGIYSQNTTGTKRLADNIVFQTYGYGFHLYTEGSYLRNFTLDGNVSFNNGMSSGTNMLVGGGTPVAGLKVLRNMTYQTPGFGAAGVWIGRNSAQNQDAVVQDNYFVNGWPAFRLYNWTSIVVTGNTLVGIGKSGSMIDQQGSTSGYQWSNNTFYGNQSVDEWLWSGGGYTFAGWRQATGLGSSDRYLGSRPSGTKVFVRPNQYERGRANIIVYNWDRAGSVSADLSAVLTPGDQYEIRSAFDFYGTPVATGTYGGGSVSVPVAAVAAPAPLGGWPSGAPATSNEFQVYVVLRRGS
jgi:hypothetical protein